MQTQINQVKTIIRKAGRAAHQIYFAVQQVQPNSGIIRKSDLV